MGIEALLNRTAADIVSGGTLGMTPEVRNIVLAQGLQFTNTDMMPFEPYGALPLGLTAPASARGTWPRPLRSRPALAGVIPTADGFEFTSVAQGVKYVVKIVTAKDAFRAALLTPNVHVIYDGHARYGR